MMDVMDTTLNKSFKKCQVLKREEKNILNAFNHQSLICFKDIKLRSELCKSKYTKYHLKWLKGHQ